MISRLFSNPLIAHHCIHNSVSPMIDAESLERWNESSEVPHFRDVEVLLACQNILKVTRGAHCLKTGLFLWGGITRNFSIISCGSNLVMERSNDDFSSPQSTSCLGIRPAEQMLFDVKWSRKILCKSSHWIFTPRWKRQF